MGRENVQGYRIEGRDEEYERTVLNFLDHEMADLQLQKSPETQSNELDSLVSSLLEQVITESDLKQTNLQVQPESLESMLSEFPDAQKRVYPPRQMETGSPESASTHSGALFVTSASLRANKGRLPGVIIALICVLGLIGAIAYYFIISN